MSRSNDSKSGPSHGLGPFRIAVIYAVIGGIWILFSDNFLASFVSDPRVFARLEMAKGWFYVSVTAVLLYYLVDKSTAAIRRSEAKLFESQRSLSMLISNLPGIAYRCAFDKNRTMEFISSGCRELTGYSSEALVANNVLAFAQLIHPDDAEKTWQTLRSAVEKGESFQLVYRIVSAAGEEKWVWEQGRSVDAGGNAATALEGFITDITIQKRAEAEIEAYTERLRILRAIDQAILSTLSPHEIASTSLPLIQKLIAFHYGLVVEFDFDTQKGVILATSPESVGLLSSGTILDIAAFEIPTTFRKGEVHLIDDLQTTPIRTDVINALRRLGIHAYMNVPLLANGELIGAFMVVKNTSNSFTYEHFEIVREFADQLGIAIQHGRLHEQISHHAIELEQRVADRTKNLAEINEELGSFAHSVSHDLRAPLRAIQGFANALMEDFGHKLQPGILEYSQRIADTALRMDNLIQDILAYSHISRDELDLQPVDLQALVSETSVFLRDELQEKNIALAIHENFPKVMAHEATLRTIFINLLGNAIKFSQSVPEPSIVIRAETAVEKVKIWIIDNGIGIGPEHHERIFHLFERLHGIDSYPGNGIGLAIVRRAATRLGGRVGVESALGQGSKFWVELPLAASN